MFDLHSKEMVYEGKYLQFSHDYASEPSEKAFEQYFLSCVDEVLHEMMPLTLFGSIIQGMNIRIREDGKPLQPIHIVVRNMCGFFDEKRGLSNEEIMDRVEDYWNWIAIGMNKALLKGVLEQVDTLKLASSKFYTASETEPGNARRNTVIAEDLLVRLQQVVQGDMLVDDFLHWVSSPLLLWEIVLLKEIEPQLRKLLTEIHTDWYNYIYEGYAVEKVLLHFQEMANQYLTLLLPLKE